MAEWKGRKRALWHVVKMRKHEMRVGVLSKKVANKGPSVRSTRESVTQVTFTAVKQSPKGWGARRAATEIKWGEGREGLRARAIMDASDGEGWRGEMQELHPEWLWNPTLVLLPTRKNLSVRSSTPGGDSDPACGREPAWWLHIGLELRAELQSCWLARIDAYRYTHTHFMWRLETVANQPWRGEITPPSGSVWHGRIWLLKNATTNVLTSLPGLCMCQ